MQLFFKVDGEVVYTVMIKNVLQFKLAMDYVSIGMSFRQTAEAIQKAKDRKKTTKLTSINDAIVDQYRHVLLVVALSKIATILDDESVWAMSLVGDESMHCGQLFFDLRLQVCYHGELVNLHLVAILMFEHHLELNIFNMIAKVMDALYVKWRAKLIGMSSDGENTMMGHHASMVTCIVTCAENEVLCIWCAPHHIDIVVKATAEGIDDGIWVKFAYKYFVYLCA
jgi:hypothetical protein